MRELRAASEDLANGYLFDMRSLIEAEVFRTSWRWLSTFSTAATRTQPRLSPVPFLKTGFGAWAPPRPPPFKKSDGLDALNTVLAKAGVYNRLTQSKVDTWRHVRNAADHGQLRRVRSGCRR